MSLKNQSSPQFSSGVNRSRFIGSALNMGYGVSIEGDEVIATPKLAMPDNHLNHPYMKAKAASQDFTPKQNAAMNKKYGPTSNGSGVGY